MGEEYGIRSHTGDDMRVLRLMIINSLPQEFHRKLQPILKGREHILRGDVEAEEILP